IQTAEGALNETHSILQRMRELAVQSANDTNTDTDREELQKEVDQLASEITRIANNTEFNTKKLMNGSFDDDNGSVLKFHIGANSGQNIELNIKAMDAVSLGVAVSGATGSTNAGPVYDSGGTVTTNAVTDKGINISTQSGANSAIETIQSAIDDVSAERSRLGAYQNRLEHTINNLGTASENLTAAESRIRDVDYTEAA
ncbi:flagellin, partial [Lederbergia graminis]